MASDPCNDWCNVTEKDHEEYRDAHGATLERVEVWGSSGVEAALFVGLARPYVQGIPLTKVPDRHASVIVTVGDDDPLFAIPSSVARSLAAALLRVADRSETAGVRARD